MFTRGKGWAGIGVPPLGSKTAVRQKVNYPKKVQIGIIVHLGYKRLMAAMAELIAIEHTRKTAEITFLTGGMDSSSSLRLTNFSNTLTWCHFTIGWCQDSTHIQWWCTTFTKIFLWLFSAAWYPYNNVPQAWCSSFYYAPNMKVKLLFIDFHWLPWTGSSILKVINHYIS